MDVLHLDFLEWWNDTNTGTSATVGLILQSIIFAVAHSSWNIWNQWPSSIEFQVPSSRTSHESLGLSSCHKVPKKSYCCSMRPHWGWSLTQLIKIREGKNPGVPGDPVLVNKSRKKIALNCSRCSRFRRSRKVVERVCFTSDAPILSGTYPVFLLGGSSHCARGCG